MSAPVHELTAAAAASIRIPLVSGIRPGDPLTALVPDRAPVDTALIARTELLAGRCIRDRLPGGGYAAVNPARIRATLRRWAMRQSAD
ncbi:hypothetical protein AA0Z99_00240 [Agrococcus sp. 1P02AA]|uniref:hypothetical protein n=1 Tax=Agrococcus sp. 1P02AA TaxID=3132259 RepID=UPI0039A5655D